MNKQRIGVLMVFTVLFVLYQNFSMPELWSPVLGPVPEASRRMHAKELLGSSYSGSTAQMAEHVNGLPLAIYREVEEQLPRVYKAEAANITVSILKTSLKYNFDPVFVLALIKTESKFRPDAIGQFGEIGLLQIKPSTAEWIAKKNNIHWRGPASLHDPDTNIEISLAYMQYLRGKFTKIPQKYVNAYNMGAANLRKVYSADAVPKIYSGKVLTEYHGAYRRMIHRESSVLAGQ